MALFEKRYEETEDGNIKEVYLYKGEELATKSDVFEWYKKGNLYTDTCDIRSKVAIGISIASIIISFIACAMCVFS